MRESERGTKVKNTYMYLRAQLFAGYEIHAHKFCGPCTKHFWQKIMWVEEDCRLFVVLQQHQT